MKLDIKHVAGYLPYGLKVQYVSSYNDSLKVKDLEIYNVSFSLLKQDKPILRPLSDLTKEIEVNGEKFVPIIKICELFYSEIFWTNSIPIRIIDCRLFKGNKVVEYNTYEDFWTIGYDEKLQRFYGYSSDDDALMISNQYDFFQKLLEWHFDIHGLIEAGLAIDINTLNK